MSFPPFCALHPFKKKSGVLWATTIVPWRPNLNVNSTCCYERPNNQLVVHIDSDLEASKEPLTVLRKSHSFRQGLSECSLEVRPPPSLSLSLSLTHTHTHSLSLFASLRTILQFHVFCTPFLFSSLFQEFTPARVESKDHPENCSVFFFSPSFSLSVGC